MKNLQTRFSVFLTVACMAVASTSYAQNNPSAPGEVLPEARFVIEGINKARLDLRSAEIKGTYQVFVPKKSLALPIPGIENTEPDATNYDIQQEKAMQLVLNDTQMSMTVSGMVAMDGVDFHRSERIVADDEHAKILESWQPTPQSLTRHRFKGSDSGKIVPREEVIKDGIWSEKAAYDPRVFLAYPGISGVFLSSSILFSPQTLQEQLLDPNITREYKGEESLYGSRCMKIALSHQGADMGLYWIDVEHDFLIRRVELNRLWRQKDETLTAGKPVVTWDMPKLISSNGVWLPAVVERRDFPILLGGAPVTVQGKTYPITFGTDYGILAGIPPTITRYTITEFNAKPDVQPADAFTINWPVGASINDTIKKQNLRVYTAEKSELRAINERRKSEGQAELTPIPITSEELAIINQQRKADGQPELADAVAFATILINPGSVTLNSK